MTLAELRSQYAEHELSNFPGENALRYEMFSPLLQNLYRNKVVYREKFYGIMQLEDILITPETFRATAIPFLCIETENKIHEVFISHRKWSFSYTWSWMRLIGESINVPYAAWTIWPEPDLVKEIEELTLQKKFSEAYRRLYRHELEE